MVGQIEKLSAINHKNQKLLPAGFYAIRSIVSLLYVLSLRLTDQAPELSDTCPQARIINIQEEYRSLLFLNEDGNCESRIIKKGGALRATGSID